MVSTYKTLVGLSALLMGVSADTCNPLKQTNCPADPALSGSISEDFSSESKYFVDLKNAGTVSYSSDGLALTLAKRFDNPSLKSNFYIMYGKTEVILKAGKGQGIISSFYLQSDDLDEIDLEWVGGDGTQFQSNYFSKGNTATYDRGEFHTVAAPQEQYHNYTIDWTKEQLVWYLDGQVVRVLANTTSEGYPQTPMYIMMGIWAGGDPSNAPGTIEWAGGLTDYSQAPFTMNIKNVVVTDYSTGKQYSYSDQSGSWQSIKAEDGQVYGRYDTAQEDFAKLVAGQSIDAEPSIASASSISSSASTVSSSSTSSSSATSASSSTASSSSSSISTSESSSTASSASSSTTSSSASTSSSSSSISTSPSTTTSHSTSSIITVSSSSTHESTPSQTTTPSTSKSSTSVENVRDDSSKSMTSTTSKSTVATVATTSTPRSQSVLLANNGYKSALPVMTLIASFIINLIF